MEPIYQGYAKYAYKQRIWSEAPRVITYIPGYLGWDSNSRLLINELEKRNDWRPLEIPYDKTDTLKDIGENVNQQFHNIHKNYLTGNPEKPIYDIITFSFGAMALRAAQQDKEFWNNNTFGKLTMIAPPLGGSAWARRLAQNEYTRKIMLSMAENRRLWNPNIGKSWKGEDSCGIELQTLNKDEFNSKYPLDLSYFKKVLIINSELPMGGNPFLDGPNDGTILTEETKFDDPKVQYGTYNSAHSMLMWKTPVINHVTDFMEFNRFEKKDMDPRKIRQTPLEKQRIQYNPDDFNRFRGPTSGYNPGTTTPPSNVYRGY